MKTFFRIALLIALLLLIALKKSAAQDILNQLDSGATNHTEYVQATFKSTRLINFHTVECLGKKTLDFRISHRFGYLSSGAENLYGLDGPASLRLGLEYSPDGRFMAGIGRTSTDKLFDGFLKYKLLRQARGFRWVTITLLTGANITGQKDPQLDITGFNRYKYFADRMSYTYQVMIGRKFGERLSLQLSPTMVHFNLVQLTTDRNNVYAAAALGRFKISKRTALTGEYCYRINDYSINKSDYHNVAALGLDLETGGHVFQVFITNAYGINEAQTIPYTSGDILKKQIRLGFNISRVFTL